MPVKEKSNSDYTYVKRNYFSLAFLKRMGLGVSNSQYFRVVPVQGDEIKDKDLEENLTITEINAQSTSFDFLNEEPNIYSIED